MDNALNDLDINRQRQGAPAASSSTRKRKKKSRQTSDVDSENSGSETIEQPTSKKARSEESGNAKNDPITHHGKHFARTVRMYCGCWELVDVLKHGFEIHDDIVSGKTTEDELEPSERSTYKIFKHLRNTPCTSSLLSTWDEASVTIVASKISDGVEKARNTDTRSVKKAVVEWLGPPSPSHEALADKTHRGFRHPRTAELLTPVGKEMPATLSPGTKEREALWAHGAGDLPAFIFQGLTFNEDDPWSTAFRGDILVKAFKHIFTSPSSAGGARRKAKRGNASLHGMTAVTVPSIAYVTTLVRFALSSAETMSRTPEGGDPHEFYQMLLNPLEDEELKDDVNELLQWWNEQIFPTPQAEPPTQAPKGRKGKAPTQQTRKQPARNSKQSGSASGPVASSSTNQQAENGQPVYLTHLSPGMAQTQSLAQYHPTSPQSSFPAGPAQMYNRVPPLVVPPVQHQTPPMDLRLSMQHVLDRAPSLPRTSYHDYTADKSSSHSIAGRSNYELRISSPDSGPYHVPRSFHYEFEELNAVLDHYDVERAMNMPVPSTPNIY